MKSKKISLAEATNGYVYSDVYGFVNSKVSFSIVFSYEMIDPYNRGRKVEREISLGEDDVYIKKPESTFAKLSNNELSNIFRTDIYTLFYTLKSRVEGRGYYGYSSSTPTEQNVVKIDSIKKVTLKWQNESVEVAPNNKKGITEFLSKEVYEYSDNFNKSEYLYDYEIKEKQFVRFEQGGTYKVVEVYPQPNKENMLCRVCSVVNGSTEDIPCSTYSSGKQQKVSTTLYKVPYVEYPQRKNELEIFDVEIREAELNPFWEFGSYSMPDGYGHSKYTMSSGNLYWQKMEEAASYTVSLYKYYPNEDVDKKLFLLEEFEVDRNKHWLTINNLFENNYIIRIKAEDRSGGILALSRGIKINWSNTTNEQKPEFWK